MLVPDSPLRAEMEPLPEDVELVSEPSPDVEMVVLGSQLSDDVPALFRQLPGLKVVQAFSAGVDGLLPLIPPGVVLCSAVGVHDTSVAEWVAAVILAMGRRLPEFGELQRRSEWVRDMARPDQFSNHPIDDLDGKTVLVLGYGSIGRALASRLTPFGARVVGVAQHVRSDAETPASLPRLLPDADVVVDLLPLTSDTKKFVDAKFFSQMKEGALFVNAGRGRTVDTDALLDALRAGRVRAALDVTDPEPLPADHPLWREPNVLITPHIAGTVARWEHRAYQFAGEQIRRYVAGQPLLGIRTGNMPAGRGLAH
ncbi:MAG TPA: 2-hydroxyacid dehydrogenase [Candidatus Dormibacteraeota bacterium]|nr:2-hydroxyacid dehydrogenase [Candidatus Dormibacteraeota bacterium]